MSDFVTIPDVEIGSVGMAWHASNGDLSLTVENLRDVMIAANDDPHIITPRLKLGHEGWPDMDGLDCNPFDTSAEPALGRVTNFRLTNDGATLVGDYTDVPAWIAAAYPSRSGEWTGAVDPVIQTGIVTPGGKRYSIVLTAVALLGVKAPAITDLEDLQTFLATGTTKAGAAVITTREDPMPQPVATRADIDTVQRSFWADFADGDYFWWWPRDIYTDPNEVLADDDEGHLFRVPFTSADDGEITWADPVRVRLDLVDLPPLDASATVAAVAASHRAVLATSASTHRTFATAAEARPAERHTQRSAEQVAAANKAGPSGPDNQEEGAMSIDIPALRTRLGLTDEQLPDDATPEQINELLAAEPETPETPETPEETLEAELEPIAAKAALLERQVADLQADKAARDTAAATAVIDQRVNTVRAASKAGVLKPHEVDTWTQRVKDPDKGEQWAEVLASMSPTFGTSELGADPNADLTVLASSGDPLPDNVSLLTSAERAQRAA